MNEGMGIGFLGVFLGDGLGLEFMVRKIELECIF